MEETEVAAEFEKIIIRVMFAKPSVRDKIIPYLKIELFSDECNQRIIKEIIDFHDKRKTFPKPADMMLNLDNEKVKESFRSLGKIDPSVYNEENLLAKIESYFVKQLLWNELSTNVELIKEGKCEEIDIQKMAEAKAFTFDDSVGLELFGDDGEKFYNNLHDEGVFVKTGLKQFDFMMNGGFRKKTFTMTIASTNIGKTLFKCAVSTQCLIHNYNVLFIPLEGIEEDIENRIMFNILNKTQDELKSLEKNNFKELYNKTKSLISNKLFIKRYNEHTFNAIKLRVLLKELKTKKNFIPDIVLIDYLGLSIPNIINKDSGNQSSMLKKASEEFHGVAKDENFALVSSMQFNRSGAGSSDPGMDDISESFGTLFTADEVILLMQTEEMMKEKKYIYKKVKARSKNKGFIGNLCVDYERQKLFEPDSMHRTEVERKQINEMIEKESGAVQEIMQKVEEYQSRKLITVDIT